MLDRGPRGFGPFRAVIRIFPGHALAPAAHSIGLDTHQQDAPAVNAAKARFKKMHERHVNFTRSYRFDFHDSLWMNPDLPLQQASSIETRKYRRTQPARASGSAVETGAGPAPGRGKTPLHSAPP